LLIAPAVVFMALVVGVPFVWAIYLSFTDAIGGSLSGNWIGFDNFTSAWHDENFRRALRNTLIFTLASQAIVVVGAAVLSNFLVRDFRGKWIIRFLVVLPWAAPVVLSTITWLWLLDSLYSVLNWTLARLHVDHALVWLLDAVHIEEVRRCRFSGSGAEPRARRDHARARVADPAVRRRHLHRGPRVDPERGRGRVEDRRRDRASRSSGTSTCRSSFRSRSWRSCSGSCSRPWTSRSSISSRTAARSTPRKCCRPGPTRSGSTRARSVPGAAISLFLFPLLVLVTILMLFFARRAQVS
jgi:hypothetical protein